MTDYDLVIIGAGPGGYVAGLMAGLKGLKTLVVEGDKLGGVCLNKGCIPTKFFLYTSQLWQEIKIANDWGVDVTSLELNYAFLKSRKEKMISSLRSGIEFLLKKRGVEISYAWAKIVSENDVLLISDTTKKVSARNIIIATGSSPLQLQGLEFDHKDILCSDSILELDYIPERLLMVGGGVIAVEFAHHFSRLGTKVYIVEIMDRILPNMEPEISKTLEAVLKKSGVQIFTSRKVEKINKTEDGNEVILDNGININVDKVLVAVSRRANTDGLWENITIETQRGFVVIDDYLRTNIKNIYAIGDVKPGFMLAHSASYEAKIAVKNILGENVTPDYSAVPLCIYTQPEIAAVGLKEEEAREKGYDLKIAKFPFQALGKARIISKTEGFVKLIADKKSGSILGAHLIGPYVTELISELCLAVKFKIPYWELEEVIHPHPAISEAIQEAIEILNGNPLHTI
ncbi:MAG TPA: dihydrolipoyl dehydrogenase [Candidatus Omnitrophica bacterium]|nr:dihydrolipoyl dehydrogenase [Candidatus Omnitrophota bacterium]